MRRVLVAALFVLSCVKGNAAPTPPTSIAAAPSPPAKTRVPDLMPEAVGAEPASELDPAPPVSDTPAGEPKMDYFDAPHSMAGERFVESRPGKPTQVGCADGQRELFADVAQHPSVAGCLATWDDALSLRATSSGVACGDDLPGTCATPADACATGWHVCGANGSPHDLSSRLTASDCADAGPGRFNAAVSHSPSDEINPCPSANLLPCIASGIGSEPVCCGKGCRPGKCNDRVWPGKTRISRGTREGCAAVTAANNPGVLCCADPPLDK